jgi:hypothetical protein
MTETEEILLLAEWRVMKDREAVAVERRRAIEDRLIEIIGLAENFEGTKNRIVGDFKAKITGRIDRKVNSELLQEIASENGLTEHLSSLFRWKPEINAAAWKNAAESITGPLSGAITSKPGRPSFAITTEY